MSILQQLRALNPQKRPLRPQEARSIAERQARRLRVMAGHDEIPMLPNHALTELPRVKVMLAAKMNYAGMSGWDTETRQYHVYINGNDAPARQRFTLAHEYKHIIDYTSHGANYRSFGSYSGHDQAEDVCDYFAGCLLVPKHLLKRAWTEGVQDTRELAQLFGVSKAAMRVRLSQTGTVPTGRHQWFARTPSLRLPSLTSTLTPELEVV